MTGHSGAVVGVAVFRDGTRLVSASADKSVKHVLSKKGCKPCAVRWSAICAVLRCYMECYMCCAEVLYVLC